MTLALRRGIAIVRGTLADGNDDGAERGRSSGVEHNLAKVGVEGSNPFARSKVSRKPFREAGVSKTPMHSG